MDNQNTAAVTATEASEAEKVMTAAGWRRESMGGNLQAWGKDQDAGEYLLISADGNCDADPLATVWTCGRYKAKDDPAAVILSPHHYSLARALERVATLAVQDGSEPEPAVKAERFFQDEPNLPRPGLTPWPISPASMSKRSWTGPAASSASA
jgi:hypothetical protein